MATDDDDERVKPDEGRVLQVHFGRSANCSSIGSFVDLLFVSTVVGTAVLSAVAVLVQQEAAEATSKKSPSEAETTKRDAIRETKDE